MVMFVTSKLPLSVRLFIFVYILVSLEILFTAIGTQESVFIINRIIRTETQLKQAKTLLLTQIGELVNYTEFTTL